MRRCIATVPKEFPKRGLVAGRFARFPSQNQQYPASTGNPRREVTRLIEQLCGQVIRAYVDWVTLEMALKAEPLQPLSIYGGEDHRQGLHRPTC